MKLSTCFFIEPLFDFTYLISFYRFLLKNASSPEKSPRIRRGRRRGLLFKAVGLIVRLRVRLVRVGQSR